MEREIRKRWALKRDAIYNLKANIDRLKRNVLKDLKHPDNEKQQLTALVIRIMINTSERIGNEESALNGHFGITQFKPKHISVTGNQINLDYIGKSGVEHEKSFSDEISANLIAKLLSRKNNYVFTCEDGFRIRPDRVNRYLAQFDAKSKDIRGFNANRMVVSSLNKIGKVAESDRASVFNQVIKKVSEKVGHGAPTLRKHYLLPEIEEIFYKTGSVSKIKIV